MNIKAKFCTMLLGFTMQVAAVANTNEHSIRESIFRTAVIGRYKNPHNAGMIELSRSLREDLCAMRNMYAILETIIPLVGNPVQQEGYRETQLAFDFLVKRKFQIFLSLHDIECNYTLLNLDNDIIRMAQEFYRDNLAEQLAIVRGNTAQGLDAMYRSYTAHINTVNTESDETA